MKASTKKMEKKYNLDLYGKEYFDTYKNDLGIPYNRNEKIWLEFFGGIAAEIKKQINPKKVLDVGCAMGFLVEQLRNNGIEAYGIDISEYGIKQVLPEIKKYCKVHSILDPLDDDYDLVICIEVLEHLFPDDAERAIENICNHTKDVVFSSTPTDIVEKTHHNVREPAYWSKLFSKYGFFRDTSFDGSGISNWAVRFSKNRISKTDLLTSYEEILWKKNQENEKIIEEVKNLKYNNPLSALLTLFYTRPDLQKAFQNVLKNEYDDLIEWAYQVCKKEKEDSDYDKIIQFLPWYERHVLAKKSNDEIQKFKEEKVELEEKNEKLEGKKVELEGKKVELEEKNEKLEGKKVELEGKKVELEEKNEKLEGKKVELEGKKVELEGKKVELEEKNEKLEGKKVELEGKKVELEGKKVELEEKNEKLEGKKVELEEKTAFLDSEITNLKELTWKNSIKIKQIDDDRNHLMIMKKSLEDELSLIHSSVLFGFTRHIANTIDKILPNYVTKKLASYVLKKEFKIIKEVESNKLLSNFFSTRTLYSKWLSLNQIDAKKVQELKKQASQFSYKPKISIIIPVYNTPENALKEALDSVLSQIYENWELCICDDASTNENIKQILKKYAKDDPRIKITFSKTNGRISRASNNAISLATGEFIGLLDHDDVLTKDALFQVVRYLNNNPQTDYIYSDEDKIDQNNQRLEAFFKPDWSPELFFCINYVTHFSVIRKSIVEKIGGFRPEYDGSQDYDLILRVTEETNRIGHIPKILYSWRKTEGSAAAQIDAKPYALIAAKKALSDACKRRGIKAKVLDGLFTGSYRINYEINGNPLISIVILNKDNKSLLKQCIDSIKFKSTYKNYEIIIVDHDSKDPSTLEYLKTLQHKVIKYYGQFNFSTMNNLGVKSSKGEYIIILNNDTKVIEPNWIQDFLEHAQKPDVGIVGGKLLFPNDYVQHAGTIVGFNGYAHNYGGFHKSDPGYFGLANVVRECSAVTAACFMIKRNIFEEAKGFDEKMGQSWQDVDICLRVLQEGKRIIYTPYSLLYHITGGTRGQIDVTKEETFAMNLFKKKHKRFLEVKDPFYNPNLMLYYSPYLVNIDLSSFNDPIDLLLGLYTTRIDLQREMPEVMTGDYTRLINWAAESLNSNDHSRPVIERFKEFYLSEASKISK